MNYLQKKITEGGNRYYAALVSFWIEHRIPPTVAELAKKVGVTHNAAHEALLRLERDGWVITHKGSLRPIPVDIDDMMAEFFCYIEMERDIG